MCSLPLADFKNAPNVSCVYKMTHTVSGRHYIGRTSNLKERMRKHWQELLSGTHKNPKITRTFHKYGPDFEVATLVIATPEYCEELEGKLLAEIDLKDSLNCHRSNIGGWRGLEWSAESRQKLSAARKGKPVSKEGMRRAVESRKTSKAWKAHMERMSSPEEVAKRCERAASPESRQKAVETRKANGHKPFPDEVRQKQVEAARQNLFAALDWAVANSATRDQAISKFGSSWGSLKRFQSEWESVNGPLNLPKRAVGERNALFKHGLSAEIKRKKTPAELEAVNRKRSEQMSGTNNPMFGRKHSDAARKIQSEAARKQAQDRKAATAH